MSMIMELYMMRDTNINYLLKNPKSIADLMSWLQERDYVHMAITPKPSLLDRILGRAPAVIPPPSPPSLPHGMSFHDPEGTVLDLDKAWHGMHYLLTDSPFEGEAPFNFLMAGEPVGDVDIGYGPAKVHLAADLKKFHEILEVTPNTEFKSRFDPQLMTKQEIYPSVWDREGEDQWILEMIDELRNFTASCKEANLGCLIALV